MTSIVDTLFGVSPERIQQERDAAANTQALAFARLSPIEQASYGVSRGAYGLAGALGGMLGGTDPELQRATQRQQIASQLDINDPESVKRSFEALRNSNDAQGAMQLQEILLNQQAKRASIIKDESAGIASIAAAGRERLQGIPNDIQIARETASLQEQISQLTDLPPSPERDRALRVASGQLKELERLTAKAIPLDPRFGVDAEKYAKSMFEGKTYAQLTPSQAELVNNRIKSEKVTPGAITITNTMPGQKALVDIPGFRNTVQRTIDTQLKTINSSDQALENINNSIVSGSFTDYRAAHVQFTRAISGAGDLSQRELKAAGADPSLLGGTADYLSSLFTSTPTLDTQKKIKSTLEAIRKVAVRKANDEVNTQRAIALGTPGYDEAAVKRALNFPELALPIDKNKPLSSSDQSLLDKYAPKAK